MLRRKDTHLDRLVHIIFEVLGSYCRSLVTCVFPGVKQRICFLQIPAEHKAAQLTSGPTFNLTTQHLKAVVEHILLWSVRIGSSLDWENSKRYNVLNFVGEHTHLAKDL